jgi:glutathione S-transferase
MIKIHHARRARSARVIWLLEELSVPYELATVEFTPENLASAEYKKLHPLGQIPAVEVDGETIIESGAIVEYLLERYGEGRLAPAYGTPPRGKYLQWFHFGESSLAIHVSAIVRNRFGKPGALQRKEVIEESREKLAASLALVEDTLKGHPFITGEDFSAADIMVSYGIVMARITRELPEGLPNVGKYLNLLKERPAYKKAWE